jgi:hypothetical protein
MEPVSALLAAVIEDGIDGVDAPPTMMNGGGVSLLRNWQFRHRR